MERVGDLGRFGQRVGECLAVGARQVHDRPAHPASPSQGAPLDPAGRSRSAATSDYVEQDASSGVHHGGAPVLLAVSAASEHQYLVETQSGHPVDARRVRFEQGAAPAVHRGHHRVPAGAQLGGDLFDRTPGACSAGRVPCRPGSHARPRRRDPRLLLGEGAHRARPAGAPPAALVPHKPHRTAERRQIREAHRVHVVSPHHAAAAHTARPGGQLDPDHQRATVPAPDLGHRDAGTQTDDQQQRTRKVNSHRDPPESGLEHPRFWGIPPYPARTLTELLHAQTRSPRNVKIYERTCRDFNVKQHFRGSTIVPVTTSCTQPIWGTSPRGQQESRAR